MRYYLICMATPRVQRDINNVIGKIRISSNFFQAYRLGRAVRYIRLIYYHPSVFQSGPPHYLSGEMAPRISYTRCRKICAANRVRKNSCSRPNPEYNQFHTPISSQAPQGAHCQKGVIYSPPSLAIKKAVTSLWQPAPCPHHTSSQLPFFYHGRITHLNSIVVIGGRCYC